MIRIPMNLEDRMRKDRFMDRHKLIDCKETFLQPIENKDVTIERSNSIVSNTQVNKRRSKDRLTIILTKDFEK